jgi:hypothetical protein
MTGERELHRRREDPDPRVATGRRWKHEDGLAKADLLGERLERLFRKLTRVGEDGELVAGERAVGEDVGDDETKGRHRC